MRSKNLDRLQKTLAFLTKADLDSVDFSVSLSYNNVSLQVDREDITDGQARALKRHFGPFKVTDNYSSTKDQSGFKVMETAPIPGGTEEKVVWKIDLRITQAYTCKKVDPAEISDMEWQAIRERAIEGGLTITDCTAVSERENKTE